MAVRARVYVLQVHIFWQKHLLARGHDYCNHSMSSSPVPSVSLLRCLSRLTRGTTTTPSVLYCRKQRLFSYAIRCQAQRSSRAPSPRAESAAYRGLGASFASTHLSRPQAKEELMDVLESTWVKKDFEDVGVDYAGGQLPPVDIVRGILRSMRRGYTPLDIAEWFSQTDSDMKNHTNSE